MKGDRHQLIVIEEEYKLFSLLLDMFKYFHKKIPAFAHCYIIVNIFYSDDT